MATYDADKNWESEDGKVFGWLELPAPGECNIGNFVAVVERQGDGRRAMQKLRKQFSTIRAIGIGDKTNPNRPFWLKMAEEGLVDVVIDCDGITLWPRKEGEHGSDV